MKRFFTGNAIIKTGNIKFVPFTEKNPVLTHVNTSGEANIVDITHKSPTLRIAKAKADIYLPNNISRLIRENQIKKGDVLATARIAGILAVKKCPELIPLTHPIKITSVNVDFDIKEKSMSVISTVKSYDTTGVEIEAMTAVGVSALTIYDMVKSVNKGVEISNIRLLSKSGGKSGDYNIES